jgi:hypothetical protein
VKATKGKEYISSNVLFTSAETSSAHIRNNHVPISLFAVVIGFFVDISKPEKKDWEMPIYNIGSMFTMVYIDNYHSNITKSQLLFGIFENQDKLKRVILNNVLLQ